MEGMIEEFIRTQKEIKGLSNKKAKKELHFLFKELNKDRKIGNRRFTTQSLVDSSLHSATTEVYIGEKGDKIFTFCYKY